MLTMAGTDHTRGSSRKGTSSCLAVSTSCRLRRQDVREQQDGGEAREGAHVRVANAPPLTSFKRAHLRGPLIDNARLFLLNAQSIAIVSELTRAALRAYTAPVRRIVSYIGAGTEERLQDAAFDTLIKLPSLQHRVYSNGRRLLARTFKEALGSSNRLCSLLSVSLLG